ncbi:hypothetical protein [Deinococcus ruber]|nr:hypothetical protein [Deinococcus ruber]
MKHAAMRIENFIEEVWVVCPHCSATGYIRWAFRGSAQLVCPTCSATRERKVNRWTYGIAFDPFFQLPLRLQTPLKMKTLWAYNPAHLAYLKAFLLDPKRDVAASFSSTVVERLPRWLLTTRRRELERAFARIERPK